MKENRVIWATARSALESSQKKNKRNGSNYIKGLWQINGLTGDTSQGCGTSGIPIRFNSQSEVTLVTLKK